MTNTLANACTVTHDGESDGETGERVELITQQFARGMVRQQRASKQDTCTVIHGGRQGKGIEKLARSVPE
eukprot:1139786-Pelagomonas_calceolata.AAC.4